MAVSSSWRRSARAPTSAHVTSGTVANPSRFAEGCTFLRPASKSLIRMASGASSAAESLPPCLRSAALAAWPSASACRAASVWLRCAVLSRGPTTAHEASATTEPCDDWPTRDAAAESAPRLAATDDATASVGSTFSAASLLNCAEHAAVAASTSSLASTTHVATSIVPAESCAPARCASQTDSPSPCPQQASSASAAFTSAPART
mmetsp:Transcript_54154/g.118090  ORF Transcript_54154/g.118090 Transcript_54154/m.118090 type:complete len:206 (+) Transcript_54154:80-697(+)